MLSFEVLLADMGRRASDSGVTFRQGVVQAWSGSSTTVRVGGQDLTDLPRMDHVTGLVAGDVVALLRCGGTLLIIGKIVKP